MPVYRYICANNPEHLFEEATPDYWCPLCDISTHPMLKPYIAKEPDPVVKVKKKTEPKIKEEEPLEKEISEDKPKKIKKKNEFPTIRLGNQIWMKKSLGVKTFSDGTPIFHAANVKEWLEAKVNRMPAWCYATDGHGDEMGILYNYYSVMHPAGLAPDGWDIPSVEDVQQLTEEQGKLFIKDSLRYEGLIDVRHRLPMGTFVEAIGKRTCWTKTGKLNYTAHSFTVYSETGKVKLQLFDKNAGYFIRCIQKS
jgi:hypothetical protein